MTKSLSAQSNPLLKDWHTPFGVPPFEQIKADHFLPAFREAIARHQQEIAAIAANPEAPTFDNTVLALEASGRLLTKVDDVFGNLVRAETNDRLQAINREVAPMRSAHLDDMVFDERLFERIRALWDRRDELALDPEQDMLLERTWKRFVRGGGAPRWGQQNASARHQRGARRARPALRRQCAAGDEPLSARGRTP